MQSSRERKIGYTLASFLLGAWAFVKINSITGPHFEPIIAAFSNPDISVEEFASVTGYHAYDPRVGLGAFNFLVCIVTQFLLELRETYPAGALAWWGIIVVGLPVSILMTVEGGRAGAKGPITYPVAMGMIYQLFGISVGFPMVSLPAFVWGEGQRNAPITVFRAWTGVLFQIVPIVLSFIVFMAPTDSQLWTTSAGMLGGPILALGGLILYRDSSEGLVGNDQASKASKAAIKKTHQAMMVVGFVGWYSLVAIAYGTYGTSLEALWEGIWVSANPSVRFILIDGGVLYLGILLFIAYRGGEGKAAKAVLRAIVLGPPTACCSVMIEIEDETNSIASEDESKKKD